ncbi:hypothetical protein [Corynebacterium macginleyi]|uniref:hypothetical protein n=1 Tax=Corynebacterium macginleyi TaxID=38290 RepID=UPI001F43A326|nr:hypothetical protein [Corynebacterium macginleyi]
MIRIDGVTKLDVVSSLGITDRIAVMRRKENTMKKATTSRGLTYASLGILAVSSSLWAMYMQDNAFTVIGLLLGTAVTAWQIHDYKATIPLAVNSIAIAAGIISAVGFAVRENFSNSAMASFGFATAGGLIILLVFAAIAIIKSRESEI